MSEEVLNSHYAVYNAAGVILRTGFCPTVDVPLQVRDATDIAGVSPEPVIPSTHYVLNPNAPKPVFRKRDPILYKVEGNTITGLPNPCRVLIEAIGGSEIVTDGVAELEVDVPGEYRIHLTANRYMPTFVTMTLT